MNRNLRRLLSVALSAICILSCHARHQILSPSIKTLQVVVNQQWTSMPILQLHSTDVLHVGFDELSHNYHRFTYRVEHCEPDWTPTEGIFESDWLEGFNNLVIEDYENSLNTTVPYTHYQFQIPNDQLQLKLSGNYRIHVIDEDNDEEEVLVAEFRVAESLMNVGIGVTANTDIDHNESHQQLSLTLNYNNTRVDNPSEQIQTFVLQNGREDDMRVNVKPTHVMPQGLRWEHSRQLIFDGGNEFHKFEMLDVSHPTMGLAHVAWDEQERQYHAFPFLCEPKRNYLYDEDADGAFYIRNSDNVENDRISDYLYVHYKLRPVRNYGDSRVFIDGLWATEPAATYDMTYDPSDQSYNAVVLQKQGYYNYQVRITDAEGQTRLLPEEGSFYQTENRYQVLVYYKPNGARIWRLVAFTDIVRKFS